MAASQQAIDRLTSEGPGGTVAVVGCLTRDGAPVVPREWDAGAVTRDDLHNSAAVLVGGQLVGVYNKGRLPAYWTFEEERWFAPGLAPLVVNVAGVRVGISIRDDLWTEEGPVTGAARLGARLVVVLNASPYQRVGCTPPHRATPEESLRDAEQLAKNLGVELETLPIEDRKSVV